MPCVPLVLKQTHVFCIYLLWCWLLVANIPRIGIFEEEILKASPLLLRSIVPVCVREIPPRVTVLTTIRYGCSYLRARACRGVRWYVCALRIAAPAKIKSPARHFVCRYIPRVFSTSIDVGWGVSPGRTSLESKSRKI